MPGTGRRRSWYRPRPGSPVMVCAPSRISASAAEQRQRADRHRDGRQPEPGDQHAVERPPSDADDQRRDHRQPRSASRRVQLAHERAPDRPSMEATDRSISPVITISIIGSAMMRDLADVEPDVEQRGRRSGRSTTPTEPKTAPRSGPRPGRIPSAAACRHSAGGPARRWVAAGRKVRRGSGDAVFDGAMSEVTVGPFRRLQAAGNAQAQPAVESDGGEQQRAGDGLVPERRDCGWRRGPG